MIALVRKYSLFYLAHSLTFFFLCAYSLASDMPNYPFLPALFFPIYFSSAVALSERETGDPLLAVLPISSKEIMSVKFLLALVFVLLGWLNMGMFTLLKGLDMQLTEQVIKLNTLGSICTLLLAAAFQLGIHFFGRTAFHKFIILCAVVFSIFGLTFFIGLTESGHNHPQMFPLIPFLDNLPVLLLVVFSAGSLAVFHFILNRGPWETSPLADISMS